MTFPFFWPINRDLRLDLDLTSHLLDLNNNELCRFQRSEANDDIDNTQVDVVLSRGLIARLALECSLPEEILHECSHIQADLRPERLSVRLEDDPLQTLIEALFD